ncbi:MAG: DNA-directed RNA polymerase subunit omega [Clostridia bacterium]|nr:DNA-directed RNA polymerase subunit omega [Clostridia bacterium]
MMNQQPTIESLLEKVDCKYTLVIVASRRARQLIKDGDIKKENPLTIAINEIDKGTVVYHSHY